MKLTREVFLSRDEFHDKAWALYQAKTFEDTQLAKVSIHTIRAVFNAVYDAINVPCESAVAPGECGSVPDERAKFDLWYGKDSHFFVSSLNVAAQDLRQARWEAWQARAALQPPNNQPSLICKSCGVDRSKEDCKGDRLRCGLAGVAYSDHVAVISAKPDSGHVAVQLDSPESRLMGDPSEDESLIACLCDDAAKLNQANPGDEMAATMLVAAARIEELQELRTGISSLDRRPNEQNAVQTEQPSPSDALPENIKVALMMAKDALDTCTLSFLNNHYSSEYWFDKTKVSAALLALENAKTILAQRQDSDKDAEILNWLRHHCVIVDG